MGVSTGAALGLEALLGTTGAGIAGSAILGAGAGAGLSALTGKDPAKGALAGGITGGFIPAGGELFGSTLGAGGAAALGGAAGGALGSAVTGMDPLTGAITGGAAGGLSSLAGGASSGAGAGGGAEAGGTGAAASALPSGLPTGGLPADLTSGGFDPISLSSAGGGAAASAPAMLGDVPIPESAGMERVSDFFGGAGAPGGGGTAVAGATPATSGVDGVLKGLGIDPTTGTGKTISSILGSKYAVPAAGLAFNAIRQGQTSGAESALSEAAARSGAESSLLKNYMLTGTLPPGAQAALDQATKAAKANVIARYAQRGLPTDPTKNSSLQQELAAVDQSAAAQVFQMGDSLFAKGIADSTLSGNLYQAILRDQRSANQDLSGAIAEFAAAAGGGTRFGTRGGINITLPSGASAN